MAAAAPVPARRRRCDELVATAVAAVLALVLPASAQGLEEQEAAVPLLHHCLGDATCFRRLQDALGGAGAAGANASNTSTGRSFDLPIRPRMIELPEVGSPIDLGSADAQAGVITLGLYGDFRGVITAADTSTGTPIWGNLAVPVVAKVALLAFANGLVVDPPARRANVTFQVIWADTCKDHEQGLTKTSKCLAPYAMELVEPLIQGRRADDPPAMSYVPPVRALIGGQKFTSFVAGIAGAHGVPNVGHWSADEVLSDKLVYPTFLRTNPTQTLVYESWVAVLRHLGMTAVDVLACDTATNRAFAVTFANLALAHGLTPAQFLLQPEVFTAYPPGNPLDRVNGVYDPERSLRKKADWDGVIAGMLAVNAHAHVNVMTNECPWTDILHYFAWEGSTFGGGHMWLGIAPLPQLYDYKYLLYISVYWPLIFGVTNPYASVVPMNNYIYSEGLQEGFAKATFWELMAYIGGHRDVLGQDLADVIPATAFTDLSSYNWQTPYTEYLVDAVFALLRAINDLVLDVGERFNSTQLLEALLRTDFDGVTGRVRFGSDGDRLQAQVVRQYRLPPGSTKVVPYVVGQLVQVGTYDGNLTLTAPFRFTRAGGGEGPDPPPNKDLDCDPGQRYSRKDGVCSICLPGTYTSRAGMAQCELCVPGSHAPGNGSSFCLPCPEGAAAAAAGSTACTACAPGKYNDALQQPECRQCERGSFAKAGASICSSCPLGSYTAGRGLDSCSGCPGVMTTRSTGSTSAEECLCPSGTYRDETLRAVCHDCPEGMSCAVGSDATFLVRLSAGNCTGVGNGCLVPHASPKYMARLAEPLRSFLCLDDVACPGGPPGTCGERHDSDKVACGGCVLGAHKSKKRCVPCQKGVNTLGVAIAVLLCAAALVLVVYAGNRDLILQSNSSLSIMVVTGITLSSIQTMGVFRSLALEWFEPLGSIFSALALIGLNLEILSLECVFQPNAATMYLFRQLAGPFVLFAVGVAVLVKKYYRPRIDPLVEYTNSAGTVFGALFISIASSCVLPLICYRHPGNNGESMLGDPSVLCWKSRDHTHTVVIGGLAFVLVLVPFMAIVAYGTLWHRTLVAQSVRGKGRGLSAFRFLFYRFRPHAYFYGALLLLRGLLICLVPVVIRYDAAFQVCAMSTLLLLAQAVQLQLQPWRSVLANVVDGASTAGLILFLVCGSAGSDMTASSQSIKVLGSVIFAGLCACIAIGVLVGLARYMRPSPSFHWFVCHHKRDAGAQARLLKMILELWKQTAFIDSDDLQDLDKLFDIVKSAVGHLLVYLTRDVLTRPWCAGEIATTVKKGTPMTGVLTPSWAPPGESQIAPDGLPEYLDLSSTTLHQYSISFENVSVAYHHLLSDLVRKVAAPTELCGQARFHSVVGQLLGRSIAEKPAKPRPGMLVVSSDPGDDEATAAAGILVGQVQPTLFSFMSEGALLLVDGVAGTEQQVQEAVWTARAVTVVLSKGTLQCLDQLKVIAYCMVRLRAAAEQPVVRTSNTGGSEARLPPFEVIPMTTPTFQFPSADFFDSTLPKLWPDDHEYFSADDVATALRSFFKRLAVNFSTHASATVLDSQAQHVVDRVPKKWQAPPVFEVDFKSCALSPQEKQTSGNLHHPADAVHSLDTVPEGKGEGGPWVLHAGFQHAAAQIPGAAAHLPRSAPDRCCPGAGEDVLKAVV